MSVKDFMTRKVVYISPDTTIAHAQILCVNRICTVYLLLKMISWLVWSLRERSQKLVHRKQLAYLFTR